MIKIVEHLGYYFYMNTNIQGGFQIYLSLTLIQSFLIAKKYKTKIGPYFSSWINVLLDKL